MKTPESIEISDIPKKVYPCCCWAVKHTSYFNVFTILIMLDSSFKLIGSIVALVMGYGSRYAPGLFVAGTLLILEIIIYRKYSQEEVYGTDLAYGFALMLLIVSSFWLGIVILAFFMVVFGEREMLPFLKETDYSVLVGMFTFATLFFIYQNYLLYLYFVVIRDERKQNNIVIDIIDEQKKTIETLSEIESLPN